MKLIKNNGLLKKIYLILICINLIMGINLVYAYNTNIEIEVIEGKFYEKERPIYIITRDKDTYEVIYNSEIYDINGKLFARVDKELGMIVYGNNIWEVGKVHNFKASAYGYKDKFFSIEIEAGVGSQLLEIMMEKDPSIPDQPTTSQPTNPSIPVPPVPPSEDNTETMTKPEISTEITTETTTNLNNNGINNNGVNINTNNINTTNNNTNQLVNDNLKNQNDTITIEDLKTESISTIIGTQIDRQNLNRFKLKDAINEAYNKFQKNLDRIKEEIPDENVNISKPGFGFNEKALFYFFLIPIILLAIMGVTIKAIQKNRNILFALCNLFKKQKIAKTVLIVAEDILREEYIAENFLENSLKFKIEKNIFGFTGTYKGKKISIMNSDVMEFIEEMNYYELFKSYNVENIIRLENRKIDSDKFKLFDLILIDKDWNNDIQQSNEYINKFIEEITQKLNKSLIHLNNEFYDENLDISEKYNLVSIEMEPLDLFTDNKNLGYNIAYLLKISCSFTTEQNREVLDKNIVEIILELVLNFK